MRAQPRLQSLSREREKESLGTKLMRAFSQVIFGMVPISFAVYVSVSTRVACCVLLGCARASYKCM